MRISERPHFEPGDVVAVPVRFAEMDTTRRRPAVVVSDRTLAEAHDLYWLCMVTSAANPPFAGDVPIADPALAGLSVPSVVRPVKLATVSGRLIARRLGRLTDGDFDAVLAILQRHRARFGALGGAFDRLP
ncbi:type II toxin-antitoxin system PemK/MazF family toxin [Azospirillum halopraeferens]|uniref:type II toxin-antitoxin system PemK/MazF family toxin n=1 Tax=Azospirillum halopraeferens TaxID=34010 RepID=UPI0003FC3FC8|nr:type II toxin-antitoxin system PemK/MazF family toxin [Azospirillum halopraeferens]